MITIAVILAILVLISLLRFGVSVEYSESGVAVTVLAGFLRLKILPKDEETKPISEKKEAKLKARKEKQDRKKAEKKAEKEAKKKALKEEGEKKPGVLKTVLELLPAAKNTLGRLRRRLLIKKLVVHYTVASEDPYKTAITFGASNAVVETLIPFLEKAFRIKHCEYWAYTDFCATQQKVYIHISISIAVWEAIYIVMAILPAGIRSLMKMKGTTVRKDGNKSGHENR